MKIFALDEHSFYCKNSWCRTTEYFLFQYEYKFGLVIYCGCLEHGSHLDFKLELINSISPKKSERTPATKSNILKDVLKDRKIDLLLRRKLPEIHYIYSDNTGKRYSFLTTRKYLKQMTLSVYYLDNYRTAVKTIDESDLIDNSLKKGLKDKLWNLYYYNGNDLNNLSDTQVLKLTDIINKNFLNQLQ
jgi:hypothetical protein